MFNFKNISISKVIKYLSLSILVLLIGIFFMSKKENLDIDEMYTYGLANNSFQLDFEEFKEYSGQELLLKYAAANDKTAFNAGNVIFNQTMDTHPPLYYFLVNFICSLNKNTFSMWFGLIINLIFMIVIFWELRYLLYIITSDYPLSTTITLLSFFTYGFINNFVFTRMYVMLSAISLAFIILIINKIETLDADSKIDFKFIVKYFCLCLVGVLTQYHFALVAAFFSVVFAVTLIYKKKYKLLMLTFISGLLSLIISYLIFPGMLNHILGGGSLHAITNTDTLSFSNKVSELAATVYTAFFNLGFVYNKNYYVPTSLIIYGIVIVCGIVLYLIKNKSEIKNFISANKLYFVFLIFTVYYFIIIAYLSQFSFARYLYNIYPIIVILIITPIYSLYKSFNPKLKYISVLMIFVLCLFTTYNTKAPFSLNKGDETFRQYLLSNKNVKTIFLYRTYDQNGNMNTMGTTSLWKVPRPLYLFRDMENISLIDISDANKIPDLKDERVTGKDDIILLIFTTENDNRYINQIMQVNNVRSADKLYFTTYYHIYRLKSPS